MGLPGVGIFSLLGHPLGTSLQGIQTRNPKLELRTAETYVLNARARLAAAINSMIALE